MEKERRSLLRWPVNWPARIQIKYKNSNKNFNCCIKNINFKGVQLILEKKLHNIDILKLTINISNSIAVPMKIEVVTHEVLEDGLNLYSFQIIRMKDSDKELIYQLIKKNFFEDLFKLWWKNVK